MVTLTLLSTWILQFMPMVLGLDIENTSVSSFDFASVFFTIGGLMPTLMGIIFAFIFYNKEGVRDFLKRCFITNKDCICYFFLHMFKNIILTGVMIYPFSDTYKILVVPVEITIDLLFYFIFTKTQYYKRQLGAIKNSSEATCV